MSRNPDNDQPRRRRAVSQGDRNTDGQERGSGSDPRPDDMQPTTPPTFGSFVSDSVRRSAGRQRGLSGQSGAAAGDAESSRPRQGTSRRTGSGNRRRTAEGDATAEPTGRRSPSGRRGFVPTEPAPTAQRSPSAAPTGTLPPALQDVVDRVGGTRQALGLLAGAIVLLILLIVLLINLIGGGDGGADTTPTATATEEDSILVPPGEPSGSPEATGTTAVPPPTTDTGAGPDRDALVTPTSGSDNQLNELPAEGTPPVTGRAHHARARVRPGRRREVHALRHRIGAAMEPAGTIDHRCHHA